MCRKEINFYDNDFGIYYCESKGLIKRVVNWKVRLYAYPHAERILLKDGIVLKRNCQYTKQEIMNINNGITNSLVKKYFINLIYSSSKKYIYVTSDLQSDELYTFI
jgi:hypothetical protein